MIVIEHPLQIDVFVKLRPIDAFFPNNLEIIYLLLRRMPKALKPMQVIGRFLPR